jgi:hypothetical protein
MEPSHFPFKMLIPQIMCVIKYILIFCILFSLTGCGEGDHTLFTIVSPDDTNITFGNYVNEDNTINILSYEYAYNGGGVAVGDFNNDGWQDLFFTGNQVDNALYLNSRDFKFRDATKLAGVMGKKGWKTGVTAADVNGDGYLDIYVCYSGIGPNQSRANQLFINNGGPDPVFTDRAKEYGLDAVGTYSTQASFFDYDRDGDLDMFLLNHAKITYSPFYNTKKLRSKRHPQFGNQLYRNENGKFTDVSDQAGIHGSGINFGLGVSISDVNGDGWPDIYVTNDYEEQDYFYLNNHDGTFEESLKKTFRHISRFAMGSDIADYNNDGLPDVFVADMLPEDNYRQKLLRGADEYDKYNLLRDSGYHHQNMRNMLQLNLGSQDNTHPQFSEIGQLAGVSNTDWSWCPLFVDLDNDGWKDLFITNGYLRDFTNMDFLKYAFEDHKIRLTGEGKSIDTMDIIRSIPVTKLSNYCFHNQKNLTFSNVGDQWGFKEKAITTGAVFADLDNDGDQDIITNNINEAAGVYRNNSEKLSQHHFIKIKLAGSKANTQAIGARITVTTDSSMQVQEHFPTRGFQSSVSHELIFGLGNQTSVVQILVRWPDGKLSKLRNIHADTTVVISCKTSDADTVAGKSINRPGIFSAITNSTIHFNHHENDFVDYKFQYLLPYKLSSNGPCLAKADVNADGIEDLFVGGSIGQSCKLYLSGKESGLIESPGPWTRDVNKEDTDAIFFDADGDGDEDLYIVRGGAEFLRENNDPLQDRLYVNDGTGHFSEAEKNALPGEKSNGSFVSVSDFDKDGDLDLFVGGKTLPGYFPLPAYCYLLRNDSENNKIRFVNVTPEFLDLAGITTSGQWVDIDNDGWEDLVIAGEFSPIRLIKNEKGILKADTAGYISGSFGLWSKIIVADVDNDGDSDLIAGNVGLNLQFKASAQQPLSLHYHDFNEDGKIDPIISYFIQGKSHVYPSRDEMLDEMPHLRPKFVSYHDYAKAGLTEILNDQQLKKSKILKVQTQQTSLFLNDGKGHFEIKALPIETQFSKVNGIIAHDFNGDGIKDILVSGNFFPYRVQLGRNDAGSGLLLIGDGQGNFSPRLARETGFFADGDVRSMVTLKSKEGAMIVCGVNNDSLKLFKINKK